MKSRNVLSPLHALLAGSLLLLVLVPGCAVSGGPMDEAGNPAPPVRSMEASRMGLAPALRPFHDELKEYGDWVLVEPRGWVFRPRVNTVAWRPYQDGHWEPSYTFGWVWESNEPFGWITDHYGFWFYDTFQGWVWQPQGAWAPAWVAWVQVGDFVGWAPLGPDTDTRYDDVPGGVFTFVSSQALAQPSAASNASYLRSAPVDAGDLQPIESVASYRGVSWNAGPDLRAVLGQGAAERIRLDEREGAGLSRLPAKSPIRDARELDRVVLDRLTANVWRAGQREFAAARARRGGVAPGGNGATPNMNGTPRVETRREPVPTPAHPDTLGTLRKPNKGAMNGSRRGGGN